MGKTYRYNKDDYDNGNRKGKRDNFKKFIKNNKAERNRRRRDKEAAINPEYDANA